MTKIEKTGRWFLITASVIEGLYYGASAYVIFDTERSLRAALTLSELVQATVFGLVSLLSFYCSFAIIQRYTAAKYFSVFLFVGSALWEIFVTFRYYSSDTDVLIPVWVLLTFVLLPTLAVGYIFSVWNETGLWRTSQSSS